MFIEPCSQLFTSINICAHRSGFENKFGGLPERKEQQSGTFIAHTILSAERAAKKKQNMIIEAAFEATRMNMFALSALRSV